ncbi:MAG TPA: sigma-70 family RNA polymerase sigma factor [Solirubrobacterales bacterium]
MAATAATGKASLAVEEAGLARAAAAGDGSAFAELYERYERRAYNLAYRLTGSEDDAADATQEAFLSVMRRLPKLQDRELSFGSYLFTVTRNACYDLMEKQRRAQPSEAIPESAAPVGAGGSPSAPDPGDPEEDPDRKLLLESQQEEIREANERLPERQREALALRELEELSYDEIAEIMDMNRNSVAQLISRARLNLRDELRGSALASIAASSTDCERALPLLAARDDGQLDEDSGDAAWLDSHLAECDRCRLGLEAMQEAGASYRAWVPIAVAPWLLRETMAKAAELTGSDWSEAIAKATASRPSPSSVPGMPKAYRSGKRAAGSSRRRGAIAAAGIAALLLAGGTAALLGADDRTVAPTRQATESSLPADPDGAGPSPDPKKEKASPSPAKPKPKPSPKPDPEPATAGQAAESPQPPAVPQPQESEGGSGNPGRSGDAPGKPGGKAGLNPTRETSPPSRPAQPEPEQPAPQQPPPEEPPQEPPREPPPERTPDPPRIPGVPPGSGPVGG